MCELDSDTCVIYNLNKESKVIGDYDVEADT